MAEILRSPTVTLTAEDCHALLDLFAEPGRLAALSPRGSQAASVIKLVGQHWSVAVAGNVHPGRRAEAASSHGAADRILDVKAVASQLGCSRRTVRWRAEHGRLDGRKVAGRWLFRQSSVTAAG